MIAPPVRAGLIRSALVAGGFILAAFAVARVPLPGWARATGMLALPCLLLAVLRREDRRLARAAGLARGGDEGRPALRLLLLRRGRELDETLHR